MMVREANKDDIDEILQLYLYLHEDRVPENSEYLRNTWDSIISDGIIVLLCVKWKGNLWHLAYV